MTIFITFLSCFIRIMDSVPGEKTSSIRLWNLLSHDGNVESVSSRREGTARDKQDMRRIGREQELNVRVVFLICVYTCLSLSRSTPDSPSH